MPLVERVLAGLEATCPPLRFVPRMDPMDELVSCILSQHAADVVTFPTFASLKMRYEDWDTIAALSPAELANMIRPVGLANQKAKSILSVLAQIKSKFGTFDLSALYDQSLWPTDKALVWLESLEGVGPKTASIVMCFAFGRHTVPVDTHVQRVSLRLGLIPPKATARAAHVLLSTLVPEGLAYRFHVALIEHGRATCTARSPACPRCELRSFCPRIGLEPRVPT